MDSYQKWQIPYQASSDGLKSFYVANIKSVIGNACPAWPNLLLDTDKTRLERIQRSATRILVPFSDNYEQRLDNLALPAIKIFQHTSYSEQSTEIADNNHHFMNRRIAINTNSKFTCRAKIDNNTSHSSVKPVRDKKYFFEFDTLFSN